jgi:hypothetical protein
MSGNYIFVQRGERMYRVASNFTNYLELGVKSVTPHYLEARIESREFVINGTLLDRNGKVACRLSNNFPEGSDCRREMTPNGYRILSGAGELLLGIEVEGQVCHLKGTVYGPNGDVIAQDRADDFLVFHGPAILGKSGGALGIVLN